MRAQITSQVILAGDIANTLRALVIAQQQPGADPAYSAGFRAAIEAVAASVGVTVAPQPVVYWPVAELTAGGTQ